MASALFSSVVFFCFCCKLRPMQLRQIFKYSCNELDRKFISLSYSWLKLRLIDFIGISYVSSVKFRFGKMCEKHLRIIFNNSHQQERPEQVIKGPWETLGKTLHYVTTDANLFGRQTGRPDGIAKTSPSVIVIMLGLLFYRRLIIRLSV